MGADASIFNGYANSIRSVDDYTMDRQKREALKQANDLNALQLAATKQKDERENAFRSLLSTLPADPSDRVKALRSANTPEAWVAADSMEKSQADLGKVRADTSKSEAEAGSKQLEARIKGHEFSLQQLQGVNDPMTAQLWAANELKSGNVTPEQFLQGFSKIPSDPAQFQRWKQNALQGGVSVLENMKISAENARNAATNATSRANNAATNAATRRGQDMTDNRERQTIEQGGKPPAGYRWNPNGTLSAIPGGPGDLRMREAEYKGAERDMAKDAKRDAVGASIAVIDKALSHPGREMATGLSGSIDPRNYIPGTNATDFKVVLDQIGGTAFLQAFESLKGGGQITEIEGKKATDAIARLNRSQSDKEFKTSLEDLRSVMQAGLDRMSRGQTATEQPPAKPQGGATVSNW